MPRALATILLMSLLLPLAGCVVAGPGYGPGPGFCAYHPYNWRCR